MQIDTPNPLIVLMWGPPRLTWGTGDKTNAPPGIGGGFVPLAGTRTKTWRLFENTFRLKLNYLVFLEQTNYFVDKRAAASFKSASVVGPSGLSGVPRAYL